MNPPSRHQKSGFSLVEVALSIGIIAFAFLALIALLPAGLTTFRRALDISICAQVAQRVVGDAMGVDFDSITDRISLPAATTGREYSFRITQPQADGIATTLPWVRYFDEQGNEIVPAVANALSASEKLQVVYQVNVRVIPRVSLPVGANYTPMLRAATQAGSLALVTVQVARNPSNLDLKISPGSADDPDSPERNLWAPRTGVDIFTYSTYLGKNQ